MTRKDKILYAFAALVWLAVAFVAYHLQYGASDPCHAAPHVIDCE